MLNEKRAVYEYATRKSTDKTDWRIQLQNAHQKMHGDVFALKGVLFLSFFFKKWKKKKKKKKKPLTIWV